MTERTIGALAHYGLRPIVWTLAALAWISSPVWCAGLFEVNWHNPDRCTLGPVCDKLRQDN
jgi:hypothetical protein